MINCNCQRVNPVIKCPGNLTIGTINATNEDLYLWLQDNATGRIERLDATSDGAGLVSGNFDIDLMPGRDYDVWITKRSATHIQAYEPIDVAGDSAEYDCLTFEVERAYDDSNLVNLNQTLTI